MAVMKEIKDSGNRRQFETGAVRDICEGKGRCDLLPLSVVVPLMDTQEQANVLFHLSEFMKSGDTNQLYHSLLVFETLTGWSISKMILEVSKQYEAGAIKYGEHNWEKGIPLHSYIDSAIRHFLKYIDKCDDEPHDRAFVWNILGAIWTIQNCTDMIDMEFPDKPVTADSDDDCDPTEHIPHR